MNLTKIFEMQRELDSAIHSAHEINSVDTIRNSRIVALLVEIGEFANEYAPFKYWKKNKNIDQVKLLEEFADGMHFLASFANESNVDSEIEPVIVSDSQVDQLLHTFQTCCNLKNQFNRKNITEAIATYLGCAVQLGLSTEELEKAYISKNIINFERIKNNY